MTVSISVPTDDQFEEMSAVDARAFGIVLTAEDVQASRESIDLDRFRIATDNGAIVAVAGSYAFDLTLPGGALLPMSGVTWVSVTASHRRQGLLRRLMTAIHDDAAERNEPLLGLGASEGAIYERFGYGIATRSRQVSIDKRRAEFRDGLPPTPGSIRIVDAKDNLDELVSRWDRFRRQTPGELSRSKTYFAKMLSEFEEKERPVAAIHDDGFATWSIASDWNDGDPQHRLTVWDMAASTERAYLDLWKTVLSVDLVATVTSYRAVAPDDRLPYLLTDPRRVQTTNLIDCLWLCPIDVAACFGARAYRTDDLLTLQVEDQVFEVGPEGAKPSENPPEIQTSTAGAGALLLGGVSATELAGGGRLTAASPETLTRADLLFGWAPVPHLRTPF